MKDARKKVSQENEAEAAVLIATKNATNAAWEHEKARAADAELLWRQNGSQRGLKTMRRP